ncbi:MAG: 23S rRNA (adenine(2030)-N(6))-methyltransferase RlmJ, partial [Pseudomonadota bacterium]
MNYRHAFHAGNFADVLKHLVLAQSLAHLSRKEKPFRFIDTHAGVGDYDLESEEARRSPEFVDGIGRLLDAKPPAEVAAALAPYLNAVKSLNADGALKTYPGSPALAAHMMRAGDALRLCELHPDDAETLRQRFARDKRVKLETRDGYEALSAYLPPPERRGLALIDPPFEDRDELAHMARAAMKAIARWPTGTFIFWRPLKDMENTEKFDDGLAEWLLDEMEFAPEKVLLADLWVREIVEP